MEPLKDFIEEGKRSADYVEFTDNGAMEKHFLQLENVRLVRELKEANEKISSLISAIENISRHFQ